LYEKVSLRVYHRLVVLMLFAMFKLDFFSSSSHPQSLTSASILGHLFAGAHPLQHHWPVLHAEGLHGHVRGVGRVLGVCEQLYAQAGPAHLESVSARGAARGGGARDRRRAFKLQC
jgi:hypothetical protein